jgi:hypothetical protein
MFYIDWSKYMNSKPFKLAIGQMLVEGGQVEQNLEHALNMIKKAADLGCKVIVLPECLDIGWTYPGVIELTQPIPGRPSDYLCQTARDSGIYVVAGLTERVGKRIFSTGVLISPLFPFFCLSTMDKTMDSCYFKRLRPKEGTAMAESLKMSAGSRNRTGTSRMRGPGILSPLCLPIPPSRHAQAGMKSLTLLSAKRLETQERKKLEATSGFEPLNRGFADLRLSHLATSPEVTFYFYYFSKVLTHSNVSFIGRYCPPCQAVLAPVLPCHLILPVFLLAFPQYPIKISCRVRQSTRQ